MQRRYPPGRLPFQHIAIAGLAALLLAGTGPLAAQMPVTRSAVPDRTPPPPTAPISPAAALAMDATEYAAHYAVPLEEAMSRLRAQEASVPATDRIAARYRDRLAGIVIEHVPEYRIVILLTGAEPVPDETIDAGGRPVPVVYRTGAPVTSAAIRAAILAYQAAIRARLTRPPGLGVDARAGMLVVAAGAGDIRRIGREALTSELATLTGIPVRLDMPGRAADFAVEGGVRIEGRDPESNRRFACTSGFVVTDGTRSAIATAAHCPDIVDITGAAGERVTLPFAGQWGAGYQDVQINLSPTPLAPSFHTGPNEATHRLLATWRNRASTRVGDFVCHQGQRTGYSCAEVEMVEYAPPGDLCAGPCTPDWVAVSGPDCARGDSGGPVFLMNGAFGLLKGGSYQPDGTCNFYYYMSTDYLPAGWRLAHL